MLFHVVKLRIISIYLTLMAVMLLPFLLTIYKTNFDVTMIIVCSAVFIGPMIPILYSVIFGELSNKIEINENGVVYIKNKTKYYLPWSKIREIGINPDKMGHFTKNCYIYFDSRIDTLYALPKQLKDYNEVYFGVQYREKIIQVIKKYWDGPINNIHKLIE